LLRTCFPIEAVDPVDVCSGDEVTVGVDGDLDRAVAHLLLHVCERCAVLDEQAAERVSQIMESKSTQPRVLKAGEKLVVNEVVRIDHRPRFRWEHEIIRNAGPARHHGLEHPDYLNHRDFKRFEEIHTKNFVKHYNNRPAENLSEEMRDAKGLYDSSSDLTFTENWMIAEGDKVAVCSTAKGTHDEAFRGVPATGKRYEFSSMTVWRFVDGKIAEEWVFFNELDLYSQLGLFKEPGSTDH
jgi:steroid delta-isomerase-like uncharacterized protein